MNEENVEPLNLPEWAYEIDGVIYVKTALQAFTVLDYLPHDDFSVVIEDGKESRGLTRLLRAMGLR